MTDPQAHGDTASGRQITDADIDALADEAEEGYDVDTLRDRQDRSARTEPASKSRPPFEPLPTRDPAGILSGWTGTTETSPKHGPTPVA